MSAYTFSKNQIYKVNAIFTVGEVQIPVNTRAIVAKGGKNPHIEFIVNEKAVAVAASTPFFNSHLVEASPIHDEALKDFTVKKAKFVQCEETNQIYLELFKNGKLVATGHNSGKGEGSYLSYVDPEARTHIQNFLDETASQCKSPKRPLMDENFVEFLALYFNSGYCDFKTYLAIS